MFRKKAPETITYVAPKKESYEPIESYSFDKQKFQEAYKYLSDRILKLVDVRTNFLSMSPIYTKDTGFCSLRGADKKARVYAIESSGWVIVETCKQTGMTSADTLELEDFKCKYVEVPAKEAIMRYINRDKNLSETDRLEKVEKTLAELKTSSKPEHYSTLDEAFDAIRSKTNEKMGLSENELKEIHRIYG